MRFFVTGGAGYIGSHFVYEAQRRGHACVVFDSLELGHRQAIPSETLLVEGDVRDAAALKRAVADAQPDVVMHYAAYALVPESVAEPEKYWTNNVGGLENLILAVAAYHPECPIVFSSSCAVFGHPESTPVKEGDRKKPESPYGETKLRCEEVLQEFCQSSGGRGMALRYFNACGADASGNIGEDHRPETHIIPCCIQAHQSGRPVTIFGGDYATPDGSCVRDYIHVTDLADSHIKAAEYLLDAEPADFEAVHVGTGRGYSNLEILAAIQRVSGEKIEFKMGDRRPGDADALFADTSKAESLLGFKAQHSDLDNIVKTAWGWHRSHPDGFKKKGSDPF